MKFGANLLYHRTSIIGILFQSSPETEQIAQPANLKHSCNCITTQLGYSVGVEVAVVKHL